MSVSNDGYITFRGSVRVLATHSIRQFPLHFPTRASPCATSFQTHSRTKACTSTHLRRALATLRIRETVDFAVTWFQVVTSLTNQTSVYVDYTSKCITNYTSLQYNVDCTPKAYALLYPPRKCILCYMSEIHCLTCWVIHIGVLCITYHEKLLCDTHVRIIIKHRASSLLVFCIRCVHRKCYHALHTCCVHN